MLGHMHKFSKERREVLMIDEIVDAMLRVGGLGLLLITSVLIVGRIMAG